LVLDTNAILDAWLFANPSMGPLLTAVHDGAVRWVASLRMREELEHTLAKPSLSAWRPDTGQMLGCFDRWAHVQAAPATPHAPTMVCRDGSDQMFVDLALAQKARWLVTHDRDLLALARRAKRYGLLILRPTLWPGTA
jgi:putative PIN family toxin of toxin-antitoxin system